MCKQSGDPWFESKSPRYRATAWRESCKFLDIGSVEGTLPLADNDAEAEVKRCKSFQQYLADKATIS